MSKHGTAPKRVVPGWYVEFQQAALRALPRDIDEETADRWRNNGGSLAKVFREALMPSTPEADTLIRVNRSVRPVYPDWVEAPLHPELELTGPIVYSISVVELWRHDKQKKGPVSCNFIYRHFKKTNALKDCLGLADLLAIQAKGIDFFQKHFADKIVFAWKSVVRQRGSNNLLVPSLVLLGGGVILLWGGLDKDRYPCDHALRFANQS